MANHSSILAWTSPWRKEPGGLQSEDSQRVGTTEQQQRSETIIAAPFAISDGPSAPLSSLSPQRDHSGRTLNVPQLQPYRTQPPGAPYLQPGGMQPHAF